MTEVTLVTDDGTKIQASANLRQLSTFVDEFMKGYID